MRKPTYGVRGDHLLSNGPHGIDQRRRLVGVRHPMLRNHRPEDLRRLLRGRMRSFDLPSINSPQKKKKKLQQKETRMTEIWGEIAWGDVELEGKEIDHLRLSLRTKSLTRAWTSGMAISQGRETMEELEFVEGERGEATDQGERDREGEGLGFRCTTTTTTTRVFEAEGKGG